MTKKITWAVLITFLALFLRVYLAVNGPFEYDEPIYFGAAVQYNLAMRSGNWDQILNGMISWKKKSFFSYSKGSLLFDE